MRKRRIALTAGLIALMMLAMPGAGGAEEDDTDIGEIVENVLLDDDGTEIPEENPEESGAETETGGAREDFIDRIVALGEKLYLDADGKRKRAHYASDIYVCKNFTVYLFRQNRDDFRMAEYPETPLVIPNSSISICAA